MRKLQNQSVYRLLMSLIIICSFILPVQLAQAQLNFVEAQFDFDNGLNNPISVTVSGDDKHVYVAGFSSRAIAVFSRDLTTGELIFVEILRDGSTDGAGNLIDGLAGAYSVVVSPDGKHVYAAGYTDNAIAVFSRDQATGKLTFIDFLQDGSTDGPGNLIDGLLKITSVTVSADGKHVYTAAEGDNAIGVFSRDEVTGRLTFVEFLQDGSNDGSGNLVDGLDGAYSVIVSADGKHVYAGSGYDDVGLTVFRRDEITGKLSFIEFHSSPSYREIFSVTESPDGKHVYGVGRSGQAIVVFSRDAATGMLSFVEVLHDGERDGSRNRITGLGAPFSVTVSPDGKHVYAAASTGHSVAVFSRDAETGRLTFVESVRDRGVDSSGNLIDGLRRAVFITMSADGKHIYVAGNDDDAVAVFSRDQASGKLTFVEAHFDGVGINEGLRFPSSVEVSADGKHIYATSESDDAIVVFSRDATTGKLTFVEVLKDGGTDGSGNRIENLQRVKSVTVSADGIHVYAAGQKRSAVVVFSREATTGKLTFVESFQNGLTESGERISGLNGVNSVKLSADGRHVYTSASSDNAIAVFSRDAGTGKLTFVEVLEDGETDGSSNLIDGLDLARGVTLSGDGKHVYAVGGSDNAIVVFSRDATTGKLTFVEFLKDDSNDGSGNPIDGLLAPNFVTVSADGKHVYAAGTNENAVAVFTRDAATGKLTFVEFLQDGFTDGSGNLIDGLNSARSIAVSVDGKQVFVVGALDNAITVFIRDTATGKLTFSEFLQDGSTDASGNLIDGLNGVVFVTKSADGKNVYVAGRGDHAIAVFENTTPVCMDFGDAPDPFAATSGEYPTLLENDGARHITGTFLFLGAVIDTDVNGQPDATAKGDDTDLDGDDEDGVIFINNLVLESTVRVDVTASAAGKLNAWIDFNKDGTWDDAGEQIFTDTILSAGVNNLTFVVPSTAVLGTTFARFRIDTGGGLSFDGLATNGEVEDYEVEIVSGQEIFRVNAGGDSYTGVDGREWEADQEYVAGSWGYVGGATHEVTDAIASTDDDVLYQSERFRMQSYHFTVPNGRYAVQLHFAEISFNSNARIFDVLLEGLKVLANFDIFSQVGHDVALIKEFNVEVTDGVLDIDFEIIADRPKISAIQVSFAPPEGSIVLDPDSDYDAEAMFISYIFASHQFSFDLKFQNTTLDNIVAPLLVEIISLTTDPAGNPISVANADSGGTGVGSFFDYSNSIGVDNILSPTEFTDFKTWTFFDPNDVNFFFEANIMGVVSASSFAKTTSGNKAIRGYVDVKNQTVTILAGNITDVDDPQPLELPTDFDLQQNYPNPFNPETTIRFALPLASDVVINIYNLHGQLVRRLLGEQMQAGSHEVIWDARDDLGNSMPSGVYLYCIKAGGFMEVRKLMLIR